MRARHFKHDSSTANPNTATDSYIQEALQKQAASRPPRTPAKVMPITPTLKKVPKLYRKRRAR